MSSGPPDLAVLSRHSGSKTGPGLKEVLLEGAPVWWLTMLLLIPKNSNEYQCLKCTAISILILNVEKYWGRFHQDIETLQIWNTDADTAAYTKALLLKFEFVLPSSWNYASLWAWMGQNQRGIVSKGALRVIARKMAKLFFQWAVHQMWQWKLNFIFRIFTNFLNYVLRKLNINT